LGEWKESQRAEFAQRVMVSAGVCFGGKGRLHFVDEKAKIDAAHYVGHLLPKLVEDCSKLLLFTFQRTARTAHDWLQANCLDFIAKDQWTSLQIRFTLNANAGFQPSDWLERLVPKMTGYMLSGTLNSTDLLILPVVNHFLKINTSIAVIAALILLIWQPVRLTERLKLVSS